MPATNDQHEFDPDLPGRFIQAIADDQKKGYRFVPFVGAGISKLSGYPLVSELQQSYLPFCIARALGIDPFDVDPKRDENGVLWTPRSGIWPDMAAETVERGKNRVTNQRVRKMLELRKLRQAQLDFPTWIGGRASNALSNWQAALEFLSEIVDEEAAD